MCSRYRTSNRETRTPFGPFYDELCYGKRLRAGQALLCRERQLKEAWNWRTKPTDLYSRFHRRCYGDKRRKEEGCRAKTRPKTRPRPNQKAPCFVLVFCSSRLLYYFVVLDSWLFLLGGLAHGSRTGVTQCAAHHLSSIIARVLSSLRSGGSSRKERLQLQCADDNQLDYRPTTDKNGIFQPSLNHRIKFTSSIFTVSKDDEYEDLHHFPAPMWPCFS